MCIRDRDYLSYIDDDEVFYMIFLDGPKAHYIYMLDECVRLLKKGGVLISDNVLYKGMTADDNHVVRRKITIVKRLRKYIDMLMEHKAVSYTHLDVYKRQGNVNGQFVFNITDNNGNSAVNITDKGNMNFKGDFETEKLSVGDNVITQDSNGVLCINGKRILVEGE